MKSCQTLARRESPEKVAIVAHAATAAIAAVMVVTAIAGRVVTTASAAVEMTGDRAEVMASGVAEDPAASVKVAMTKDPRLSSPQRF